MATFRIAMNLVSPNEGGWVNDSDDTGKETYCGIARAFWPNWEGWKIVDSLKNKHGIPVGYKQHVDLAALVDSFYRKNFWDKVDGDSIASQAIANQVMDAAVNEGIIKAIKRLQSVYGEPQSGVIDKVLLTKIKKSTT